MKIIRFSLHPVSIPRTAPLALAYATRTACRSILLEVTTDDGRTGWGEAVPVREVTGERLADVRDALERVGRDHLIGLEPVPLEPVRPVLLRHLAGLPSARCAIDAALADLRSQASGIPLPLLLGGARESVRASVTIGILPAGETVAQARRRLGEGFGVLKLKLGTETPAAAADRVRRVREAAGPAVPLLLDANQAFDVPGALALVAGLRGLGVALLEQPVAAADLDGLCDVARRSPVPVCADEAVRDLPSLLRVLERKAVPLVNIKLQKCGGPTEAAAMLRMMESFGVRGMIGCMTETNVGIAAGLAVAQGCANVDWVDLDGALDLEADPVALGGPRLESGRQWLPPRPGRGLELDHAVLTRYRLDDLAEPA